MKSMASDPRSTGGPNKSLGETGPNTSGCLNMEFTDLRKKAFCEALIEARGNREVAAKKVGVHRATVTRHMRDDAEFRANIEGAMEEYRHILVSEAHRRGVEGTRKPVFFQGKRAVDVDENGEPCYAFVREYDTPLLIALLKRWCPEFKDKSIVENRNMNVDMGLADLESLSPEQQRKLRELLDTEGEQENGEPEQ